MRRSEEFMSVLQCLGCGLALLGLVLFGVTSAVAQDVAAEEPAGLAEPEAVAEPAEAELGAGDEEVEMTDEEAEAAIMAMVEEFGWERGGTGTLGSQATIAIPEGYRFTGRSGTEKLMKLYGNPPSPARLGTLAPEDLAWFVIFTFDDVGYVKDDEKDELDAAEMLEAFQQSQEEDNQRRAAAGEERLFVDGWAKEPFYNETTNKLEWALRLRTESGELVVNYKTRLLGRLGVMDSILVCGPEELDQLLPTYQGLIGGYNYTEGNSYAEYKKGDRVAEYGLKGLMVGGGVFAAAKLGLFGVLGKFLSKAWVLLVAVLIGIKSWLGKLFSRNKNQYTVDS